MFPELPDPRSLLVSALEMQEIEESLFRAGMPVAALMEKVSFKVAQRIQELFPQDLYPQIGILAGVGHNGGDGLVIARELALAGRQIRVWMGEGKPKPLTAQHRSYLEYLGVPFVIAPQELIGSSLLIDALFGIGLNRPLTGIWEYAIAWANQSGIPIVSLDIPSGIQSEDGSVLGIAIRAQTTFCLGLWKQGVWQDPALDYLGHLERIDFGIPSVALSKEFPVRLLAPADIKSIFTPPLSLTTHKYQQGSLLLICGSQKYGGAAVLTALGSRPSGAGMVTVAVPGSLKSILYQWVPEMIIHGCPESPTGGIQTLGDLDPTEYTAIGIGPGLSDEVVPLIQQLLATTPQIPWVLDADGLNSLAQIGIQHLLSREATTILTPHLGEFRRLFPEITLQNRIQAAQQAAQLSQSIVILKGARTIIADPGGQIRINPESTPALARGGSGDVLTGLVAGILAQRKTGLESAATGVWWHSQTALRMTQQRGITGVDPVHLAADLSLTRLSMTV
jgi:NAD(P)H-hydrate epimerase